jgi:hypothetical protein
MYSRVEGDLAYLGDPSLIWSLASFTQPVGSQAPRDAIVSPQGQDVSQLLNSDVYSSHVSFYRSTIRKVFEKAYFRVTTFQEANLSESQFFNCSFDSVAFDFAKLTNCEFVDCKLQDVSFGEADLTNARMERCVIDSMFAKTLLRNFVFERCEISGSMSDTDLTSVRSIKSHLVPPFHVSFEQLSALIEIGLTTNDSAKSETDFIFENRDPEPADETEAWYRRTVLGEKFLGDS